MLLGSCAVHPGYGFLSENTEFASKLTQAGITWVGPCAKAIHAMGDKIESKRIATRASTPPLPLLFPSSLSFFLPLSFFPFFHFPPISILYLSFSYQIDFSCHIGGLSAPGI